MKPRLLDLFSGAGGFSLGFDAAGYKTVAFSEIEPFPCSILAHRYPTVPNLGDVTRVKGDQVGRVDVITAGFPCQDLSVAGKRGGLAGSRSGLFWEVVRLARETRAPWVVLENVPGLLSSNQGRDFGVVLDALDELGYGLSWAVLDAQHFGVPQRRRRVFVVGRLGAPCPPEILFEPEGVRGDLAAGGEAGEAVAREPGGRTSESGNQRTFGVAPALHGYAHGNNPALDDRSFVAVAGTLGGGSGARGWAPDTDRMTFVPELASGNPARYGNGPDSDVTDATIVTHSLTGEGHDASEDGTGRGTPLIPDVVNPTGYQEDRVRGPQGVWSSLAAQNANNGGGGGGLLHHQMAIRRLTPTECEKLMGWPPGWTNVPHRGKPAADGPRYRACGNGVAAPVVEYIARRMLPYVLESKAQ
jgi:DNA (cytosine-5)-methyltransferase 1